MQNPVTDCPPELELAAYETVFFIAPGLEGWLVKRNSVLIGRFANQRHAIRFAALAAQTVELQGRRATFRIVDQLQPPAVGVALAAVA
ncbi:MAG: hypothetical protein Tsb0016_19050 [Sphingomonadales bacterium]